MANIEKKRARKFTQDDVELLTELVFRYKHVIENKKTDSVTVKQKNEAWESISIEFSASASHPRTAEQLRNFYKNTKSKLKQELAKEKADSFRTGGGTATVRPKHDSPLLQIVQAEITPLHNPYDSSHDYYNDNNQPSTSRGVRNKHEEAYNEFIRLGGDPAMLGDDTPAYPDFTESGNTPPHSLEDIGSSNNTPAPVDMPPSVGLPTPATPPAPASEARPTPVGPNTIRNNKRQRINFNTLREYVGEFGDLKKRKYELQNKLLELQIQKLQQELNTSQE